MPGRGEYLKENAPEKPISSIRPSVAAKSRFGFAGKADDEIGRQREIGPRIAQAVDDVEIIGARVPAVHGRENAVGARLHRQMQLRHELRQIAMRRN